MLDIFCDFLPGVYHNWQEAGRIPGAASRGVVTLLKQDVDNKDVLQSFRLITLLNKKF